MRHYASFKLPRGTKSLLIQALERSEYATPLAQAQWRQFLLPELLGRDVAHRLTTSLLERISEAVGTPFRAEEFSSVLHWGSAEEVPRHADQLAKTCFLIPLRSSKTLEFFEGYERCRLQGKRLVRFNDFEDHGLSNPNRGHFVLLTLSRDCTP